MSECRAAYDRHCIENGIKLEGDYYKEHYFTWASAYVEAVTRVARDMMESVQLTIGDITEEAELESED